LTAAFLFLGVVMLCYLNRGIIIEQVIAAEINTYLTALKLDDYYKQHHIHVTLTHPFASLFREKDMRAADHFPAVIVSTYEDKKNDGLNMLRPQTQGNELSLIGYTREDFEKILDVYEPELVKGKKVKKPGICTTAADSVVKALLKKLEADGYVYGCSLRAYRTDHISIEIWAENIQLKNEIYEQLRLFVLGGLRTRLADRYAFYDTKIDDDSVFGRRSGAWNFDFDTALAGAAVNFEVAYTVEQNVLDTDWEDVPRKIIIGGTNYVKQ
jgi:hypothetical protein